jgi:tetratricopeptide (TPR) repeat protein
MLNQTTPCLSAEELRRYSEGRADEALRFRVEEHILDCALCEAALEGYASAGNPGAEQVQQELEQLKMRIMETRDETPATVRPLWFNRVAAAAVVLMAFTAAWMYWNHTADDRLFASAFQPDAADVLILRGEEDAPPEQALAIQLYQQGAHEEAMPHFKNYLSDSPEDYMTTLAAGIAAIEAGQTAQAIEWLETVRFNDTALYGEATWYLALSHWKQEDRTESIELMRELAAAKDPAWAEKAEAFLEKIK